MEIRHHPPNQSVPITFSSSHLHIHNMSEQNLAPKEQPVNKLDSKAAFELLTTQEKFYAHYLSQGIYIPNRIRSN